MKHSLLKLKFKLLRRPRAGAWIETFWEKVRNREIKSPPRGGVD